MINAPAPIAPELAFKEEEHSKSRQKELKQSKVRRRRFGMDLVRVCLGSIDDKSTLGCFQARVGGAYQASCGQSYSVQGGGGG